MNATTPQSSNQEAKPSATPSSKTSRKPKSLSPRGRLRQSIQKAVKHRGRNAYNLTYLYSPKMREDIVAAGDLAYFAALWIESRPDIAGYTLDLPLHAVMVGDEVRHTAFDVQARFTDGRIEHWELKPQAEIDNSQSRYQLRQRPAQEAWAKQHNATVRTYSEAHFRPMRTRLQNWATVVAALTRTRNMNLGLAKAAMAARLANGRAIALKDLIDATETGERAVQISALFTLLAEGRVLANLDATLMGPTTPFVMAQPAAQQEAA